MCDSTSAVPSAEILRQTALAAVFADHEGSFDSGTRRLPRRSDTQRTRRSGRRWISSSRPSITGRWAGFHRAVRTGAMRSSDPFAVRPARTASGEQITVEGAFNVITDERGRVQGVILLLREHISSGTDAS